MSQTQRIDLKAQPIRPTVGRIVLFTPGLDQRKGQPYPAIVTHVHSDVCVNLSVFNDGSYPFSDLLPAIANITSVDYDQDGAPATWAWMPYQLETARRLQPAGPTDDEVLDAINRRDRARAQIDALADDRSRGG